MTEAKDMAHRIQDLVLEDQSLNVPENVLFQEVEDEMVLLDLGSGQYFGLNEVGARIWSLFQEGLTVGAVLGALLKEYDVSEEQIRSDLQQFLDHLMTLSLVGVHENPTP